MMELYYLKHKERGFMPEINTKYGHTWSEPTHKTKPRMFGSEISALRSLRVWATGTRHRVNENDVVITPIPSRTIYDWEVKKVIIE